MKNFITGFLAAISVLQFAQAQGTVYLSNLGESFADSNPIGSDSWMAAGFYTGNNSGGYLLGSVQLGMAGASGSPSGFTVMIYNAVYGFGVDPGSSLGALNGSANPSTAGIYTYTPSSSLMLSADTAYFIVLTAGTAATSGNYAWNFTNASSYNSSDNWLAAVSLSSGDGLIWVRLGASPNYDYSEFAIAATAIPEPGILSLLCLGGLGFVWRYRNKKKEPL